MKIILACSTTSQDCKYMAWQIKEFQALDEVNMESTFHFECLHTFMALA